MADTTARYLRNRAESYARDGFAFDRVARGAEPPIIAGDDARWAVAYLIIAGELRLAASRLEGGELMPRPRFCRRS